MTLQAKHAQAAGVEYAQQQEQQEYQRAKCYGSQDDPARHPQHKTGESTHGGYFALASSMARPRSLRYLSRLDSAGRAKIPPFASAARSIRCISTGTLPGAYDVIPQLSARAVAYCAGQPATWPYAYDGQIQTGAMARGSLATAVQFGASAAVTLGAWVRATASNIVNMDYPLPQFWRIWRPVSIGGYHA